MFLQVFNRVSSHCKVMSWFSKTLTLHLEFLTLVLDFKSWKPLIKRLSDLSNISWFRLFLQSSVRFLCDLCPIVAEQARIWPLASVWALDSSVTSHCFRGPYPKEWSSSATNTIVFSLVTSYKHVRQLLRHTHTPLQRSRPGKDDDPCAQWTLVSVFWHALSSVL